MSEERIKEIIEALDHYDGHYKRAEMEEAVTLKEEIAPSLIRILEELAANPVKYAEADHYANFYAVALLAHFRESAAHLPIIRAFLIDEESREELWGDMVTGTLPALLFQTCDGSLDAIKELIVNKSAYEYVRSAAVEALIIAVVHGITEREEVIGFLSGLFSGDEADEGSYLWSNIAASIADIHPEGAMDVIRQAYADGLVDVGYVGLEEIEADCLRTKEALFEELHEKVDYRVPSDIHGYLSMFACFRENDSRPLPKKVDIKKIAQEKRKSVNRAKKKMARKSRRKNRR